MKDYEYVQIPRIELKEICEKNKQLKQENEQLKIKINTMKNCYFNGCIGCNDKKCEVKE